MRYALMTEPQQGLSLRRDPGPGPHRRGGRARGLLPLRPLRQLPRRVRHADHRRLGHAGRPGARDRAIRLGVARLAGDLPHPGQPGQGHPDGRRDERRTGRGRLRRRLERGRARASWASRSRRSASATTCSRSRWRSSTACGPSPTAGRTTATHWQVARLDAPRRDRRGAAAATRTSSSAARAGPRLAALVARYGDEFNLNSASPDDALRRPTRRVRAACRDDRPRSGRGGLLGHDRRARGRDRGRPASARRRPAGALGQARCRWRRVARRAARTLDHGHAGRGPRAGATRSKRPASSG